MPTALPNPRITPRFAGLCTFGRYPRLEDVAAPGNPVDWAIYGVPFDGGVTYRPGARFGPRAIRAESQYLKRYSIEHDLDLCAAFSLADAGDSPVAPYSCQQSAGLQFDFARKLGDPARTRLLALGGDHSIAFANIRASWERAGRPARGLPLIHFDAHLDTVDAVWDEKWGHASVFRRAIEARLIDPTHMVSIGIRGPLNARSDLDFAREHGVTLISTRDLQARGPGLLKPHRDRLLALGRPAYISFDIDCIDPAFAPGTGTPSIAGLTPAQALDALRVFRGVAIAGADVVEVLPDRDPAGITALLAAHIAFEILCLDAGAPRARGAKAKAPRPKGRAPRSSRQARG